ncbi:MAG: hexapeptide transferase [Bacilli bacterium]|nr:hexapeptide transferase [Bacilli bacterium]
MKRISYLVKRIFNMDYKRFFRTINNVKEKTGKSKFFIFFDIVYCGFKYQAGYLDYLLFEMYELNKNQRKTILTRGINNSYIKKYNDKNYTYLFREKQEFNKMFKDYIKRDWILLNGCNQEAFDNFIKNKKNVFAKPLNGTHGDNMQKINIHEWKDKNLYQYLMEQHLFLIEELVIQNEIMNSLNPSSINTIRVISICKNNKSKIIAAYSRIGSGKIVDNFNAGGMVAPVDIKSGKITYPAVNKKNIIFTKHPETNISIEGFQIPEWENVKELVLEAAKVVPQVGLVGWDVAISEKGPLLIEGNEFPGHDIYQLPPHRKNGIGMLPVFEKAINNKK